MAQIAMGKSELTAKTYGFSMAQFAEWLQAGGGSIKRITRHDVQSYFVYLDTQRKSPATIEKNFAALVAYANFVNCPHAVQNIRRPAVRKTKNIAPKSLTRNERNRLLREVEQSGNLRNIAMVYLLLYTGLRVSELSGLDLGDVDMSDRKGKMEVRHGKGNIARSVPMPREVRYSLSRYLEGRKGEGPALFLSSRKKRISPRTVEQLLQQYGTHPHALRHTFCRELVQSGVDIVTVAELAGHADVNVTRRYASPTYEQMSEAIERAMF
ncbi:recombinase XerC [Alicyclobacillaceae bacterium I2511]|nr:recombinase XerC [Alicyclobacillaceae bacterium I2511]